MYVYNIFRHSVESVDLEKVLFEKRRIQRYHKRYLVNAWTIESEKDIDDILPYVDTVTFQHMDDEIVRNKLKNKNPS